MTSYTLPMLSVKPFISALLACSFLQVSFAQQTLIPKKRFPVKNISYETGLLDNNVNSIVTDGGGFTWVSTFTGLQRFNGYNFITIKPIAGKDTFLINYPVYLFGLKNGNIWISINEGVLEYNHIDGTFKLIISYKKNSSVHFGIVPMKENNDGIWCMQEHKGIVLYDNKGNLKDQFGFYSGDGIDSLLRSDVIIYDYVIASNDSFICINHLRNQIIVVNTFRHTSQLINVSDYKVLSIACRQNRLYMISNPGLLIKNLETGEMKMKVMDNLTDETNINNSIRVTPEGALLISRNGHLYAADPEGNIQYELTDKNYDIFVANGYIQKIYPDGFNRIWVLSNDAVKRIENSELLFEHLLYAKEQHNFTRALYYDEEKHVLLAGGYNGAIQLYDSLSAPMWEQQLTTKLGEYIINIEKLCSDDYFVVVYHKGWFVFNLKTKQMHPVECSNPLLKQEIDSLQMNYPNNLCRINDSVLLAATDNNIYRCTFRGSTLAAAQPILNIKLHHNLDCFLLGKDKNIWAGTVDGFLYKTNGATVNNYQVPGNYIIRSLSQDKKNNILVGTERGLFVYNTEGKLTRKFEMASGLANDCIYSVIPADNGYFVSTNLGISSIADDGSVHNYSREMGLQENEFNTNASLRRRDGKIFFGGVNGITAFLPVKLLHVTDTALVHITQLTVDDSSYNPSSGIWSSDSITLNYRQNRLRFDIAAMGMLNANEYVYQYRLKGLDTSWQTSYEPTNISYTLQPANYTLEIKCHPLLSSGQVFTKNFTIVITPPFWQTWWFRILILALAIAMVYFFIYRYNKNKYLKKIRQLETQHQIQTERERISRELHDNIGSQLSLMISNIDWTIDSVDKIPRSEEIQRLSSINSVARNVMTNLRESIWALNKEKITLDEFADKLKAYIQNITEIKPGLEFISHESIKSTINFPPTETLNIFRICQEVINNIIKHADATLIEISIAGEIDQTFSITITDNGKGFDASVQKGYGLENMRFRAGEMNLQLKLQSKKGEGTAVRIYK